MPSSPEETQKSLTTSVVDAASLHGGIRFIVDLTTHQWSNEKNRPLALVLPFRPSFIAVRITTTHFFYISHSLPFPLQNFHHPTFTSSLHLHAIAAQFKSWIATNHPLYGNPPCPIYIYIHIQAGLLFITV